MRPFFILRTPLMAMSPWLLLVSAVLLPYTALAHDVAAGDKAFVQSIDGAALGPFVYLGAKHMVTGLDHILFLIGVVFYLRRLWDVLLYVSLFTLGHSLTLLLGVWLQLPVNPYLIDAIIGLSVIYKGAENLGLLRRVGIQINTRLAVLCFGLCHGLGLATKVLDLSLSENGLLSNLLAFNVGVEMGQAIVLLGVVLGLRALHGVTQFSVMGTWINRSLVAAGVLLAAYQFNGYLMS